MNHKIVLKVNTCQYCTETSAAYEIIFFIKYNDDEGVRAKMSVAKTVLINPHPESSDIRTN